MEVASLQTDALVRIDCMRVSVCCSYVAGRSLYTFSGPGMDSVLHLHRAAGMQNHVWKFVLVGYFAASSLLSGRFFVGHLDPGSQSVEGVVCFLGGLYQYVGGCHSLILLAVLTGLCCSSYRYLWLGLEPVLDILWTMGC